MKIEIKPDNFENDDLLNLLKEHHNEMLLHSPPENVHAFNPNEMNEKNVIFWSSWFEDEIIGCGALKKLNSSHAEIKSMRTVKKYLKQGVAKQILQFIISQGQQLGYKQLSLETGSMDAFIPARKLYEKFGFNYCSAFDKYAEDKHSVFMTIHLLSSSRTRGSSI